MKHLALASFTIFCALTGRAQLGYGPDVGVGVCNMHFAPAVGFTYASTTALASGRIGGMTDYGLRRKTYIQSGLYLERKGQSRVFSFYTNDSLNGYYDQRLTLNYLEVPVNLVYKTGTQGKGRAFLGVGVTAGYLVGGKNRVQAHGSNNDTAFTINSNETVTKNSPLSKFDVGVNVIGGYEFATGWVIRIYYTGGVKDLGLGSESDKNRVFGISVGHMFGKGRNINKDKDELIDKGE